MKKIFVTLFALLAIFQVSYAQWSTGSGYIYPITLTDKLGLGLTTPVTPLHVVKTTEQLRLGYNDTNYGSFTTSSAGNLALTSTGGLVSTPVRFSIGSSSSVGAVNLSVNKAITGGSTSYGALVSGPIQSDVTTTANLYSTSISTQATTFTLGNLIHYNAIQSSFGAGSSVLNQFGFYVGSSLIGANKNYAFYGGIPAGTNRWNIYMNGTADNYLAGNLGIGTTTPNAKLDVGGFITSSSTLSTPVAYFSSNSNSISGVAMRNVSTGASADSRFAVEDETGNYLAFSMPGTNNAVSPLFGLSRSTSCYLFNNGGTARNMAIGTLQPSTLTLGTNNTARLTILGTGGNIGIGTTTPDEKLTVRGKIHALEVRIDTDILPDYVFDKDYALLSLTDIKNYIDKNHHLPEVPSAAEVEKNGLKLGEMNLILLKKVEELTLHLIDKDKQMTEMQNQINELKKILIKEKTLK